MTFNAREISLNSGNPIELYRFSYGGVTFLYTSSDAAFTLSSETYTPEPLIRSNLGAGGGEDTEGAVTVRMPRSNPAAAPFVAYTAEPPMGLQIIRLHRDDGEPRVRFVGSVASALFQGAEAVLTCLPESQDYRRRLPRNTYQPQCNWQLGSSQCGVDLALFSVVGIVTVISADTIVSTAFATKPDGYFNNGFVQRVTGERRWIVGHVGATLTLLSPFIGLAVNEPVTAFSGCDRTEADCATKFSNLANHFGFARVPSKNPFTAGLT